MKAIKILGHPVLLMSTFLLLIIEGDNFGGIYLVYLLLAAPHGAVYAIIALLGLTTILIGFKLNRARAPISKSILYLTGIVLMLLSLIIFFSKGNKNETFIAPIPLLTFILFALMSVCFLINAFLLLLHSRTERNQNINIVM